MDEEKYYSNEPDNNKSKGDSGTVPMVLGLCSLILALTFSRLVGFVLGIIAVVKGSKLRHINSDANAGFVMGIIGICISAVAFLILFLMFTIFLPLVIPYLALL